MERKKIEKANNQKKYYDDLKKGIEDKKRNEYFDKMMHDNDSNVMHNKKQETDFMHQGLKDRQKEEKVMLGQIYQNQINQAKQIKDNEKAMEKELERVQIEKMQAIDPDAYNKLKKKAYQNEIRQELDQKNKLKQYDNAMREQSVRESRKLIDEYAKKEMLNEQGYRSKFTSFDKNMEKRLKDYNSFVMKPQLEKESNQSMIERRNINEYNKKLEEDEKRQMMKRQMQIMDTSNEIKNQMNEKNKIKQLNNQLGQIEGERTSGRIFEINTFDQMLKEDKKKRQEMYRQMLSSQIQYNNGLKSFGNMTSVEKAMNKDDLSAYKRYDNTQYGMIPGINTQKKYPKTNTAQPKKQTTYDEQQRRLETYGYGRYLKKVPTDAPIENYNGGMSQSRSGANAFNQMNRSYTGQYPNSLNQAADSQEIPNSRRNQNASPRSPGPTTLRNAGAISMSRENQRAAGSPTGMNNPYKSQVL